MDLATNLLNFTARAYVGGRYIYGFLTLQKDVQHSAFVGTDLKLSGSGFPIEHPKYLSIEITQKGFHSPPGHLSLSELTDTMMKIKIPEDIQPGVYELTVTGPLSLPIPLLNNSDTIELPVFGAPVVTAVQPDRGFPARGSFSGSQIFVYGNGFDPINFGQTMGVTIGGANTAPLTASKDSLTTLIPEGAKNGDIVVTTPAGRSPVFSITLLGAPVFNSFEPGVATPGAVIELLGRNFDVNNLSNNFVTIGGTKAEIVDARTGNKDETILRVKVPTYAEGSEIVIKTPAVDKGVSLGGFQLKPIIETVHPKKLYVGDSLVVRGKGLMKDATAYTTSDVKMLPSDHPFSQIGDHQEIGFVIPEGAQSGSITVRQGPTGVSAVSADPLEISRIDELQRSGQLFAKPFFWRTSRWGDLVIDLECEDGRLVVTGSLHGSLDNVGMCPIDVDVDPSTNHAFTANAKAYPKEGISEIDLSDPTRPRFVRPLDSGGANPTRIKILRGGQLALATEQGAFVWNGTRMDRIAEGKILAILKDTNGDDPYTTVISKISNADGSSTTTATALSSQGIRSQTQLDGNVTSATQVDNKIYVANFASDNLWSFNPHSNARPKSINLGAGAHPFDLAINLPCERPSTEEERKINNCHDPKRSKRQLFVSESGRGEIGVVDLRTDSRVAGIDLGGTPKAMEISPTGCLLVVFDEATGKVIRVDTEQYKPFGVPLDPKVKQPVLGFYIDPNLQTSVILADGHAAQFLEFSCP
jgi:hypothetical protein